MKRQYPKIIAALLLGCIQSAMLLGFTWMLSSVVDIVMGVKTDMSLSGFAAVSAVFLALYLLVYYLSRKTFIAVKCGLRVYQKERLFSGFLWEKERCTPGEVTAKFQQQIDLWESDFLDPLFAVIKDGLLLVISFLLITDHSWVVSLGAAALFCVYLLLTKGIGKKCESLLNGSVSAGVEESGEVITMVSSYPLAREQGREAYFVRRYGARVDTAAMAFCRCNQMYNILSLVNGNLTAVLTVIIIAVGGMLLSSGAMDVTVGQILGFTQLISTLVGPIGSMGTNVAKIRGTSALRAGFRSYEKRGLEEKERFYAGGAPVPPLERITLEGVCFAYEGTAVLENVSMELEAGKKYAIVGESGSGKTTLLKLILKELPPDSGKICWNGIPYERIGRKELLGRIGYAAQEPMIFRKSIQDNIVAGSGFREGKDEGRLWQAIDQSGLKDLRDGSPEILTVPAQELSGGERKRAAYARALYKNCDVLVLDEPLSSLHEEMADRIERDITSRPECLVIHVTHRMNEKIAQGYDGIYSVSKGCVQCVKHP